MPSFAGNFLSITILIVFVFAPAGAAAQQTDANQSTVGSSRLTGRVVAADNGKPVRRAYVSISRVPTTPYVPSTDAASGWSVQTDANGHFEFDHLPAGSYNITIEPVSGFVRPSRVWFATLSEKGTAQVTATVVRAGAIEGRVLDENGHAVLGVQVSALRRINIGGYVDVAGSGRSATTDDRGRFRIFDVPPGEHYVVATYMPPHRELDGSPLLGYTNTYYPRSLRLDDARHVVVRGGHVTQHVDLTLATRPLVRVAVRAINSKGVPLDKEARLHLTRRDPVSLSTSIRSAERLKDGMFVFDGITPGDYYLVAAANNRLDEGAYVNVTVGDQDVSLNVQTNTGARISGRMRVDGRPVGDGETAASGRTNVWVSARRPLRQGGVDYTKDTRFQAAGSDRFELSGLRGPMMLHAEIAGGMLVSIRRGDQDIADQTLDFIGTETIDDIVIDFTMKTAQVDVTVTGGSEADDPESVLLLLFSDDPSLWHSGHIQYSRVTAARVSAGQSNKQKAAPHTTLSRMVPGAYRIIAIRNPGTYYPTQAAILEKLRPLATPVTLVAGHPAQISIGVTKLER